MLLKNSLVVESDINIASSSNSSDYSGSDIKLSLMGISKCNGNNRHVNEVTKSYI